MKTAIVILAAGSSSRMGEPKQLLPFGKTTLLGNAIEIAQQTNSSTIFCVLGANYESIKSSIKKYSCEVIFNPNFADGLSTSIKSAVKELQGFDSILFTLGDQPKITSNFLAELLILSKENPSKIIASNYGSKNGVPAVFPMNYFSELLQLSGDKGARELLNTSEDIISLKNNSLIDIDTIEDYKKLLKSQ